MMPTDIQEVFHVVKEVINVCPEEANLIDLYEAGILDMARKNDKRPAYLKMYVNDNVVKNIKGVDSKRDLYVILRIPRPVVDLITSPIIQKPALIVPEIITP